MEDEIKIVNCGCGGKSMLYISPITTRCLLQCESCKIETAFYDTEIEAVEAGNKAMGAKDINVPNKERTAKVIKHKYWFGVSLNVVGEQTIGQNTSAVTARKR